MKSMWYFFMTVLACLALPFLIARADTDGNITELIEQEMATENHNCRISLLTPMAFFTNTREPNWHCCSDRLYLDDWSSRYAFV